MGEIFLTSDRNKGNLSHVHGTRTLVCAEYTRRLAKKEEVKVDTVSVGIKLIADVLKHSIRRHRTPSISDTNPFSVTLMLPDKASDNYAFVGKRYYDSILVEELGLNALPGKPNYNRSNFSASEVLDDHKSVFIFFGIVMSDDELALPYILTNKRKGVLE